MYIGGPLLRTYSLLLERNFVLPVQLETRLRSILTIFHDFGFYKHRGVSP